MIFAGLETKAKQHKNNNKTIQKQTKHYHFQRILPFIVQHIW